MSYTTTFTIRILDETGMCRDIEPAPDAPLLVIPYPTYTEIIRRPGDRQTAPYEIRYADYRGAITRMRNIGYVLDLTPDAIVAARSELTTPSTKLRIGVVPQ
jgi:hypothetical protein